MSRFNTQTVVVDHAAPTNKIVMTERSGGTGEFSSSHRVTDHPAGFRVRERGALDELVVHQYRCPVHGVFDRRVPRSDVPDEVMCAEVFQNQDVLLNLGPWRRDPVNGDIWVSEQGVEFRVKHGNVICGLTAPWAGSSAGQGVSSGEVKS